MCTRPAPADAWGFGAHRDITARAIALLPDALRPFFEANRAELTLRAVDPDLWRLAGWEDGPNHFLDLGLPELGPYPFAALPRDRASALEKFGAAGLQRIGQLPWRADEEFGRLSRAFQDHTKPTTLTAATVVLFAAALAHYVQDAYQPLHATNNNDGQLTDQLGVHSRFETALFERYRSRLSIVAAPVASVANARDAAFDALLASHQQVDALLLADRDAAGASRAYDAAYYTRFFERARPLLEKQLAGAVAATAAFITGAWEQAGKPAVRVVQSAR